jgi:phospholipase/lecithinase/hemolysin
MVSADLTTLNNPFDTLVSTCATPSEYVWWDSIQPTAAVHALIGDYAARTLELLL